MKTKIAFLCCSVVVLSAFDALAQSNDFGKSDHKQNLTPKDLRERLQVDGTIIVSSPEDSRILYQAGEFRSWRPSDKDHKILSNWNFENFDGSLHLALKHEWTIGDDGQIRVHFEQFDSMQKLDKNLKAISYGKKIKDETVIVKDFSPVSFVVSADSKQRVVAQFVLSLRRSQELSSASETPISLVDAILTDNKGKVWSEGMNGSGKFFMITTFQGTVALSYFPFPGSAEVGVAEENMIDVKMGGFNLKLRNARPLVVAQERLKVYGAIKVNRKSEHAGSTRMNLSSDPEGFAKDLKE